MAADGQGLRGGEQEDVPTMLTPPAAETGGEGQQGEDSKPGIGKRPRLLLVGLFFALMGVGVGVNSYHGISYVRTAGDPGWLPGLDGRVRTYSGVSGADLSGVRDGDQVVALDGQGFEASRQYFETFARHAPGAAYTMTVRRGGRDEQLTLRTAPYHPWVQIIAVLLLLILPATFLLTGLGIFLLKPDNKQALLLALMLGMAVLGGYPPFALPFAGLPRWLAAVMTAGLIVGAAGALPVMLNFFLVFPERSPLLVRFPRLEIYLYPFFLLTAAPFLVVAALQVAPAPGRILVVLQEFRGLLALSFAVGTGYLLGALLSLVANYRRGNQVSRRKLRLILVATVAAFMPSYLLRTLILSGLRPSPGPLSLALITVVLMALMLFPLSFAYAIMRHQVIPVSLLVRRSVQYLLARNALRLLLALPVIGLLVTIFADPDRTLPEILFRNSVYFYLLLIAALALSLISRRRLGEWIDRRFFREAYQQERILRELTDDLKRLDSPPEMFQHVGAQVERALHPEQIYLFYRDGERQDLSLSYSFGVKAGGLRIPAEFCLLSLMETRGGAQEIPFPQKNDLPPGEKAWLAGLGARLIVPMTGTDARLAGLFLLGEKKSEVPYTARDRGLLEALASQIAIVCENLRLKERIDRDREIRDEVLGRFEERRINLLKECPTCGACFDSVARSCARDGSELTLSLPVERTIDGRYRLDQLLGKGGMGAVYEATDLRLNREVAVKVLGGRMFGNGEALRRFEREARTVARLSHPHIIAVHDYGVLSTEGAYLVMELVPGKTLGAVLKREGRVDPGTAAEWFDQVLEGVEAAHRAGVIHRDLKPDNLLISPRGDGRTHVSILDFGLAKITLLAGADSQTETAVDSITTPGTVMGTFGYMSPEQLTGGEVDGRSDLFAVGVMVVEALTGRRPFVGKTYHELLTATLQGTFGLPRDTPEGRRLDDVLQRCLAKEPRQRYASAGELQRELIPALRRCGSAGKQ